MPHTIPRDSLATWIQRGLILIVALMPFHAFLSVWLGHLFGHQAIWQSWKELLLLALTGAGLAVVYRQPARLLRWRSPLMYCIGGFVVVSLLVTLVAQPGLGAAAYGVKTDIEFLVAFAIGILVGEVDFMNRLVRWIMATSGVVIAFGLLQIYVLPADWLRHFGYGPSTIQPYLLVDPAVRSIRILATLGGPNQLGSWLILPLSLVGWQLLRRPRWWQPLYLLAGLLVMWHTYSRSAWLGLAVAAVMLVTFRLPRPLRLPLLLVVTIVAAAALSLIITLSGRNQTIQYYLFHQSTHTTGISASTDAHVKAYQQGIAVAAQHPLGEGLGSAGPASFHSQHPFIPENYYLQLAIETGLAGLALFAAAEILLAIRLALIGARSAAAPALLATLAGIAIINFALHGWADSSTALIFWTLAGAAVGAGTGVA